MVEIGGWPILWHIMKIYSAHGFNEFVVALGYKGAMIKDYFLNYRYRRNDLTINLADGVVTPHDGHPEQWKLQLIDTGESTETGGRIRRISHLIGDEPFLMTYGDGVGNIDVRSAVAFHRQQGRLATVTAVRPPARFGTLTIDDNAVTEFTEKPLAGEGWINGGFFVLEPRVIDYIDGDHTAFERAPLARLAREGQLSAYRHPGFWHPMDTVRDMVLLERLWSEPSPPWRIWS